MAGFAGRRARTTAFAASLFVGWAAGARSGDAAAVYVKRDTFYETFSATREAISRKGELRLELGLWHATKPLAAKGFGDSLFPEKGVDLDAKDDSGAPVWEKRPQYVDGRVHGLPLRDNAFTYLYRVIGASKATSVGASLGSDDGVKLWLNDRQIYSKDIHRGAEADQEHVVLDLAEGDNRLLMRINNGGGPTGFYFALRSSGAVLVWERLRKDFPAEADWLVRDSGRRHLDLLGGGVPDLAREMAEKALDLAQRTLSLVERHGSRPDLAAELGDTAARVEAAKALEGGDWLSLYLGTRSLRRRIVMSHPLLGFDKLLVNRRPPTLYSHQCDQYLGRHSRVGPGLTLLTSWKDSPQERILLEGKLPPGCSHHPDLSYDAKRVLFSFCDHTEQHAEHRRFWVYEAATDGSWVKQLTGTERDTFETWEGRETVMIEDWDPCYLPGGGFVFISTRSQGFGRCHGGRYTPAYLIYRADADGSNIRQVSFGEANEWDPSVMNDGRLVYTRWDYINRHDVQFQSLWTARPDGTDVRHFYGNYTSNPQVTADAKAIPGSHKVVTTTQGHHSYTAGSIIVIDPHRGEDGPGPVTRVTPEACFPESEGWPEGSYATPWPLSEDLYLVAHSHERLVSQGRVQGTDAYGIYLIDTLGGREFVYRDPQTSTWSPIPLVPRRQPPAIPSMVAGQEGKETGTFWIQDVHRSTQPIPKGSIRSIRVNRIIGQPAASQPARSVANNEITKRILGYVPVEADGSAMFTAPAGVPLQFQALDENGMAVMTMRTIVYLHPGETQSCVGCHEPRRCTTSPGYLPSARSPREIDPPAGPAYEGGFSFVRAVQPVLDRHCIGCHGLEKTEGNLSLLGTRTGYSTAYDSIVSRGGMIRLAQRNQETPTSSLKDYFAYAGRFGKMTLAGHPDADGVPRVELDRESRQRIMDWLDLNVQFYGDYSFNRVEHRRVSPEGERALRDRVRELFGEELASQPLAALVNHAMASESRILKAPLAAEAGGWGQVPDGWSSADDPRYREMLALAEGVFVPNESHDVAGTCGRPNGCRCGSCWVRRVREDLRAKYPAPEAKKEPR